MIHFWTTRVEMLFCEYIINEEFHLLLTNAPVSAERRFLSFVTEVEAASAPSVAIGAPHCSDGAVAGFYEDQIVDRYAAYSIIEGAIFVKVPSEFFIGDLYSSFIIQTAERRRQFNMKQIQCSLKRWGRTQ